MARGGDRALVGRETDAEGALAVPASSQLPNVEFSATGHLRRPRLTHVGVVSPHDGPGVGDQSLVTQQECVERLCHVTVSYVP